MFAERLGQQLRVLHLRQGLPQVLGQVRVAGGPALGVGQAPDVVLGRGRQLVLLLHALQPGRHDHRVRQVRVTRRIQTPDLHSPG